MQSDHVFKRRQFIGTTGRTIIATGACQCLFQGSVFAATARKGEMIAPCGLYCGACSAMLKSLKAERTSDVVCLGCLSSKGGEYTKKCEIRKCAKRKKVTSCGECDDYPCEKISEFTKQGADNPKYALRKKYLDEVDKNGLQAWSREQEKRWTCTQCREPFGYDDDKCPKCGADVHSAREELAEFLKK